MFGWATSQFEKLAQTVAPQPTDPPGRFIYACQNGDEQGAIALLSELQGVQYAVQMQKSQTPLHFACMYSMSNLAEQILSMMMQLQMDCVSVTDSAGNTPLHFAAMSKKPNAIDLVKTLITRYGASVTTKNSSGQTPYDLSSISSVRQYLLPMQLQEETKAALDNGGAGLIPGMDLGGLKVNNSHLPPPPMGATGAANYQATGQARYEPPPMPAVGQFSAAAPAATSAAPPAGPPATMTPPPVMSSVAASPVAPPPVAQAPSSGNREYSRGGFSSAAIGVRTSDGRRLLKPDGFHSSSSDKTLQQKYGHSPYSARANLPPPPRSGEQTTPPGSGSSGTTAPGQSNPFAGGRQHLGSTRPANRYVAVDPLTGQTAQQAPTPGSYPGTYTQTIASSYPAPTYSTFQPGQQTQQRATAPVPPPNVPAINRSGPAFPPPPQMTGAATTNSPSKAAPPPVATTAEIAQAPKSGSPFAAAPSSGAQQMFAAPPNMGSLSPPSAVSSNVARAAQPSAPPVVASSSASLFASPPTVGLEQSEASAAHVYSTPSSTPAAAQETAESQPSSVGVTKGSPFGQNPRESSSASDFFSAPPNPAPADSALSGTIESTVAPSVVSEQTIAPSIATVPSVPPSITTEDANAPSVTTENTVASDQFNEERMKDEDEMDDVPLSPSKSQNPSQDSSSMQEPTPTGLSGGIGMPPPPYSKS